MMKAPKALTSAPRWGKSARYCVPRFLFRRSVVGILAVVAIAVGIVVIVLIARAEDHYVPSAGSLLSDWYLLFNNDLSGSQSSRLESAFFLSTPDIQQNIENSCGRLGEELLNPRYPELIKYALTKHNTSSIWIAGSNDDDCTALTPNGNVATQNCTTLLPGLCSNTAPFPSASNIDTSAKWRVDVYTASQRIRGYRDRRIFNFKGVRYAPQPTRFEQSTPFDTPGEYDAQQFGSQCLQGGPDPGSEDCLFLNVYTPFLPQLSSTTNATLLRPVMFWVHGGAFDSGTASSPGADGGNLASRGDVVVVTINYRLGTLGFLALNDTATTGNYGFGDQINALNWVRSNIRNFGGDPSRITIFGQSAGAASVRAMLASPASSGKFAGAIMQSNLGGYDFAESYSSYYNLSYVTSEYSFPVLNQTNCLNVTGDRVECLRRVSGTQIANLPTQAAYLVQDDNFIPFPELPLNHTNLTAKVPILMGTMANDGLFFINGSQNTNNLTMQLGTSSYNTTVLANVSTWNNTPSYLTIETPSFPSPFDNVYNISIRAADDGLFRCVDQATAAAGVINRIFTNTWYYEFDRAYVNYPGRPECSAPPTSQYPNGDPRQFYYKCHSGDVPFTLGNLAYSDTPDRDGLDYLFSQLAVDYWSSFARSGDPNPDPTLLQARGFNFTLNATQMPGYWKPVGNTNSTFSKRLLSPTNLTDVLFTEASQCADLRLPISMFQ